MLRDHIIEKLTQNFKPYYLEVEDFSERHKGHAGYGETGESHFAVVIVSDTFENLPRPARHRLVYDALSTEFTQTLHALRLKTMTKGEYDQAAERERV